MVIFAVVGAPLADVATVPNPQKNVSSSKNGASRNVYEQNNV